MSMVEPRPTALQLRRLLQVYASALRADPSDLVLRTKLAEVLRLLGRHEEAISLYSSVAWAHGVSGNLGQAILICKLILELSPTHSATQEMLAKLYASKQIREQKQSVPVVKVGGRWVADPRRTGEVAASGASVEGSSSSRELNPFKHQAEPVWAVPSVSDLSRLDVLPDSGEEVELPSSEHAGYRGDAAPRPRPPRESSVDEITACEIPGGRQRRPPSSGPMAGLKEGLRKLEEASRPQVQAQETAPGLVSYRAVLPAPDDLPEYAKEPTQIEEVPLEPGVPPPYLSLSTEEEPPETPVPPPPSATGPRRPVGQAGSTPASPLSGRPRGETPSGAALRRDSPPKLADPGARSLATTRPAPPTPEILQASRGGEQIADPLADTRPAPPTSPRPPAAEEITEEPVEATPLDLGFPASLDLASEGAIFRESDPAAALPGPGPAEPPGSQQVARPDRLSLRHLILSPEPALQGAASALEDSSSSELQPPGPATAEPQGPLAQRQSRTTRPGFTVDPHRLEAAPDITGPLPLPAPAGGLLRPGVNTAEQRVTTPYAAARRGRRVEEDDLQFQLGPPPRSPAELAAPSSPPAEQPGGAALPPAVASPAPIDPAAAQGHAATGPAPRPRPAPQPQRPTERMDSALVNSLLRLDAEQAVVKLPAGPSVASIQREVQSAWQAQEERELELAEAEQAERNLLDTLREPLGPPDEGVERFVVPFPLFSDLDTPAFLAIIRQLDRRIFRPGDCIFSEGDPGDSLYLVSSGVLQVLKKGDDPESPIELARLGGGSFFGEFGLLTDGRRHAAVRCVEECELLELRREVLVKLCEEHPSITGTLRTFYQQRVMANVLATSPVFKAVSPEDRKAVLSRFSLRRFLAEELIIAEDQPGTGFFVILVGTARVSCRAEDGSEVPLGLLREGNYFGEISLLSGFGAEATVRAGGVTEVLMLTPEDFYALTADHPAIWNVVQREAERRRLDTERQLAARQPRAAGELCLI